MSGGVVNVPSTFNTPVTITNDTHTHTQIYTETSTPTLPELIIFLHNMREEVI